MLKLNNMNRAVIALVIGVWIIALAGLIGFGQLRAGAAQTAHHTLEQSLANSKPQGSDIVVGELVNPALIYGADYSGYTMICPQDPIELSGAKMNAFGLQPQDLNLSGKYGYVALLPQTPAGEVTLDKVNLSTVNICTVPQTESYPLNTPIPFYFNEGTWVMGVNA